MKKTAFQQKSTDLFEDTQSGGALPIRDAFHHVLSVLGIQPPDIHSSKAKRLGSSGGRIADDCTTVASACEKKSSPQGFAALACGHSGIPMEPTEEDDSETEDDQLMQVCEGLRQAHASLPEQEPPPTFHASLRSYQRQALRWMCDRETFSPSNATDQDNEGKTTQGGKRQEKNRVLHPLWVEFRFSDGSPYYWNRCTGALTLEFPAAVKQVRAGILADAMGLGKTVEALALICAMPASDAFLNYDDENEKDNRIIGGSVLEYDGLGREGESKDNFTDEGKKTFTFSKAGRGLRIYAKDNEAQTEEEDQEKSTTLGEEELSKGCGVSKVNIDFHQQADQMSSKAFRKRKSSHIPANHISKRQTPTSISNLSKCAPITVSSMDIDGDLIILDPQPINAAIASSNEFRSSPTKGRSADTSGNANHHTFSPNSHYFPSNVPSSTTAPPPSRSTSTPALLRAKATLVVCPMSLLTQWKEEAELHTRGLSVLVYYGQDRKLPALSQYDIIITTFGNSIISVFRKALFFLC